MDLIVELGFDQRRLDEARVTTEEVGEYKGASIGAGEGKKLKTRTWQGMKLMLGCWRGSIQRTSVRCRVEYEIKETWRRGFGWWRRVVVETHVREEGLGFGML